MTERTASILEEWAEKYNDPLYFEEDPIFFPRKFAKDMDSSLLSGEQGGFLRRPCLQDVEIAALFAAHFAWGRRSMIVRDCNRLFDEMDWRPYDYVMAGDWRNDGTSIHRTVKWKDVAGICARLKAYYSSCDSLEMLTPQQIRTLIFAQKEDPAAANKKIHMMRRWFVRDDGRVDLGLWKNSRKEDLVIPLDVHVHRQATELGLTQRRQKNLATAMEITDAFRQIFPSDPCKGDFALFGYGVTHS